MLSITEDQIKSRVQPETSKSKLCTLSTEAYPRRINRDEIKVALNKIYAEETKPVNVRSIKNRTGLALILLIVGTVILGSAIGFKNLFFEPNIMIIGFILLLSAFPIGFILSTKYMRKIYSSMSRFKDQDIPSYRRVAPKTRLYTQGLVYAALLCLILLGAQSVNFVIFDNDNSNPMGNLDIDEPVVFNVEDITLGAVVIGEAEKDLAGQYFRKIGVEINNSNKIYSKNLILEIESWFAGKIYDKYNTTLDHLQSDMIVVPIKIHEPDDTSILTFLKYRDSFGEQVLGDDEYKRVNDIYITKADGVISKLTPITKSIEITVEVYNDGLARAPESVTVIISSESLLGPVYRDSMKNNETIKRGESWETTFTFDILDEESVFDVKLKLDEKTKDEAEVLSA